MKYLVIAAFAISLSVPAFAKGGGRGASHSGAGHSSSHANKSSSGTGAKLQHEHVSAYRKSDGTRVKGHERSTKDGTTRNNWSTKGNVNPVTGKKGSK